jgi:tRNA(His) 5'-end guanylyltransferase
MNKRDSLGNRMKEFYENIPKTKLVRRTPVAIRIDGKAFHTFTRGFKKPFDRILMTSMQETMKYLCENIQGCVLGYTQSDEITLILIDYQKLTSSAWFDYEVQKICSISASMTTLAFNKSFKLEVDYLFTQINDYAPYDEKAYMQTLFKALDRGAMFDARCFNIPKEEVCNLIYWRQLDATRNSIQMVGQANFSHKELQNKSCRDIQDMLMMQKGINWNNFAIDEKRGSCCIKNGDGWIIDREIPIFKGEDRDYIEKLIRVENND